MRGRPFLAPRGARDVPAGAPQPILNLKYLRSLQRIVIFVGMSHPHSAAVAVLRFRNLAVGQTFDFVDDSRPALNSFYSRCMKTGTRAYCSISEHDDNVTVWTDATGEPFSYHVDSINASVFHVGASAVWEARS